MDAHAALNYRPHSVPKQVMATASPLMSRSFSSRLTLMIIIFVSVPYNDPKLSEAGMVLFYEESTNSMTHNLRLTVMT